MNLSQRFKTCSIQALSALGLPFDQSDLVQNAQMLGDGGICDVQLPYAIPNGPGFVREKSQQLPAVGIGDGMEYVGIRFTWGHAKLYLSMYLNVNK